MEQQNEVPATQVYYATGNVDHDNESFKRGDAIRLTQAEAEQLLFLGAVTDNPAEVGAVAADETPEIVQHPNPRGEVQPSQIPHPVTTEQDRIAADFQNHATTVAEVAQAAQPAPAVQPTAAEIAATLATTETTVAPNPQQQV